MAKVTSKQPFMISAVTTPLHEDDSLHVNGLEAHLEEQWQAGINGLLVAGSMGAMQLLTDRTYAALVEHAIRISAGRGEIMIGVGDTSLARTRQRIELVNRFPVDGVVVVTPYLFKFEPKELVAYYRALADSSRHPLYLYDLPTLTGVKLDFETVERVAEHPNVIGIKASCEAAWTKELIRRMGDRFRIIIARQPWWTPCCARKLRAPGRHVRHRAGVDDGSGPRRRRAIGSSPAQYQRRLTGLLELIRPGGVFRAVTAIFNAREIPASSARRHDAAT